MIEVHHIGSTSIPGIAAKPIVDMMPVVRRFEDGAACIAPACETLGYEYRGEYGIAGTALFRARRSAIPPGSHAFAAGNPEVERHLLFRDYLRTHPGERDAYEHLKRDRWPSSSRTIVQAYAEAKTPFCDRIVGLARAAARARS